MKNIRKISVAGAALLGLAAFGLAPAAMAQATPPTTQPAPDPVMVAQAQSTPTIDSVEAQPAGALPTGTMAATGQDPSQPAQVIVQPNGLTVTNGPVPDTPANRAKYGGPMSHAGKKTAPSGN
jgi:hypothetical protein